MDPRLERRAGWRMVFETAGYAGVPDSVVVSADERAHAAVAEQDGWDGSAAGACDRVSGARWQGKVPSPRHDVVAGRRSVPHRFWAAARPRWSHIGFQRPVMVRIRTCSP